MSGNEFLDEIEVELAVFFELLVDIDREEGFEDRVGDQWLLQAQWLDLVDYLRRFDIEVLVF